MILRDRYEAFQEQDQLLLVLVDVFGDGLGQEVAPAAVKLAVCLVRVPVLFEELHFQEWRKY